MSLLSRLSGQSHNNERRLPGRMTTFTYLDIDETAEEFEQMKNLYVLRMKYQRQVVRCIFVLMLLFCSAFISYHITNGVEISRAPSLRKGVLL